MSENGNPPELVDETDDLPELVDETDDLPELVEAWYLDDDTFTVNDEPVASDILRISNKIFLNSLYGSVRY